MNSDALHAVARFYDHDLTDVDPVEFDARVQALLGGNVYDKDHQARCDADNQYAKSRSHHVSNDRWLGPEGKARAVYNPHARDADLDRIVQEGTPFARPYTPRFNPKQPRIEQALPPQKAPEGTIPIETPYPTVGYPVAEVLNAGRRSYLQAHPEYDDGELRDSYADVRADPDTERVIAAEYASLPLWDDEANAAYDQFMVEVDQQYDYLIGELGIVHEVTATDPYATVEEMIADIRDNHHLFTLATAATGSHADLSDAENDKKRAVHDAFGHAASGRGFDRHGEEAAYQSHAAMFSKLAQRAAVTDFRGQNATLIVYGERAKQKHALMPVEMGDINYRVGTNQMDPAQDTEDGQTGVELGDINYRVGINQMDPAQDTEDSMGETGSIAGYVPGPAPTPTPPRRYREQDYVSSVRGKDDDLIAEYKALIGDDDDDIEAKAVTRAAKRGSASSRVQPERPRPRPRSPGAGGHDPRTCRRPEGGWQAQGTSQAGPAQQATARCARRARSRQARQARQATRRRDGDR